MADTETISGEMVAESRLENELAIWLKAVAAEEAFRDFLSPKGCAYIHNIISKLSALRFLAMIPLATALRQNSKKIGGNLAPLPDFTPRVQICFL